MEEKVQTSERKAIYDPAGTILFIGLKEATFYPGKALDPDSDNLYIYSILNAVTSK